jgi:hypothetical protein
MFVNVCEKAATFKMQAPNNESSNFFIIKLFLVVVSILNAKIQNTV